MIRPSLQVAVMFVAIVFVVSFLLFVVFMHLVVPKNKAVVTVPKHSPSWSTDQIPKIIHQTAPKDVSKWRPEWIQYNGAWKKLPGFSYKLWSDEDLEWLIKTKYPAFYELYQSYPKNINRFDMVRYFILYEYGGIYVDMDYEYKRPFYTNLQPGKVSIAKSKFSHEVHQNAFMASPKRHPFWLTVFSLLFEKRNEPGVVESTGPRLIDAAVQAAPENMVDSLSAEDYNTPGTYVEHHHTASWT